MKKTQSEAGADHGGSCAGDKARIYDYGLDREFGNNVLATHFIARPRIAARILSKSANRPERDGTSGTGKAGGGIPG